MWRWELLNDNARSTDRRIRLPQRSDDSLAPPLSWAEVNEKHLVFVVLDDLGERMPALGQIDRRELALEDRVLQVVAEIPHGLEDLAKPLVVADVVADKVGVSHGRGSTRGAASMRTDVKIEKRSPP